LLIPHEEVLIVDARQMKAEIHSIDCSFKHQTGVT